MRALLAVAILVAAGCGDPPAEIPADSVGGQVSDTAREPIVGATVFAIPAELVAWSPLTAGEVKSTATSDFDETLERLIDTQGATFPHGQFIVQPGHLAAEREMAICGQSPAP